MSDEEREKMIEYVVNIKNLPIVVSSSELFINRLLFASDSVEQQPLADGPLKDILTAVVLTEEDKDIIETVNQFRATKLNDIDSRLRKNEELSAFHRDVGLEAIKVMSPDLISEVNIDKLLGEIKKSKDVVPITQVVDPNPLQCETIPEFQIQGLDDSFVIFKKDDYRNAMDELKNVIQKQRVNIDKVNDYKEQVDAIGRSAMAIAEQCRRLIQYSLRVSGELVEDSIVLRELFLRRTTTPRLSLNDISQAITCVRDLIQNDDIKGLQELVGLAGNAIQTPPALPMLPKIEPEPSTKESKIVTPQSVKRVIVLPKFAQTRTLTPVVVPIRKPQPSAQSSEPQESDSSCRIISDGEEKDLIIDLKDENDQTTSGQDTPPKANKRKNLKSIKEGTATRSQAKGAVSQAKRKTQTVTSYWRPITMHNGKDLDIKINTYIKWFTESERLKKLMDSELDKYYEAEERLLKTENENNRLLHRQAKNSFIVVKKQFLRMVTDMLHRWYIFHTFSPAFARQHLGGCPQWILTDAVRAQQEKSNVVVVGNDTDVERANKKIKTHRNKYSKKAPVPPRWVNQRYEIKVWDDVALPGEDPMVLSLKDPDSENDNDAPDDSPDDDDQDGEQEVEDESTRRGDDDSGRDSPNNRKKKKSTYFEDDE